jgi:hypothetical protein
MDNMSKKILMPLLTVGLLLFSGAYAYQAMATVSANDARQSALKACANKIPNTESSQVLKKLDTGTLRDSNAGFFGGTIHEESVSSYSRYPAFDRCMAGKGF